MCFFRKFFPIVYFFVFFTVLPPCFAYTVSDHILRFNIISDHLDLNKKSFASIKIARCEKSMCAISVLLTRDAAAQFHAFTSAHLSETVSMVWGNFVLSTVVIRSPLGASMVINGFPKEAAKEFVRDMRSSDIK